MVLDLSGDQKKILATFHLFRKPISLQLVSSFTRIPEIRLNELIKPLKDRNWLADGSGLWRLGPDFHVTLSEPRTEPNDSEQIAELAGLIKSSEISCHNDIIAVLELLLEREEFEKAIQLAWQPIHSEIKKLRYKNALEISAVIVSRLEAVIKRPNLWKPSIDLVLIFAKLDWIIKWKRTETIKALELIKEPCRLLGDERRLAIVLLCLGRRYISSNEHNKNIDNFKNGFDIVERLGDHDIEVQAAPFYGYFYGLQGLCRKALTHLERIGYRDRLDNESVPDIQIVTTVGMQAALSGEYHIAIGVLSASWRKAVRAGNKAFANFYRAYLGQVLLMKGLLDEALSHLDAVLEEINPDEDTFIHFFILRAKAYYLFQLGRANEAYIMLREGSKKSSQMGSHRIFYAVPWVLEMLHYFHQNGYPPIPHYHFQTEVDEIHASPNIQLKAVVLRISARDALEEGKSPDEVRDSLLKSEQYLIKAGNPVELAKTRIQLSLLLNQQGDRIGARKYALQAWDTRFLMDEHAFPPDILPLIGDFKNADLNTSNDRDILSRFLDMLDSWSPSENQQEILHHIILSTTRFFRAERGAIFLLQNPPEDQGLTMAAGCNFMPEDLKQGDWQTLHEQACGALQTNSPIIIREHFSNSSWRIQSMKSGLCIPFNIGKEKRGILYYDTVHIDRAFDWCDNATLSRISKSIRAFLNHIWNFSHHLDQKQRVAIPAVVEASEQESGIIITSSHTYQKVIQRADRAALSDAPVLILGETGVGKEIIAKRVHLMSNRRDRPFIAVNLASIPESLIESELFGHEKGAFTGADKQKLGRMELANKGTLFIDEIGEIPNFVQVKLLRVLEDMAFVRIGGIVKRNVNFRLIAATNRDLTKEVGKGNFRADLFYRLNVVPIFVPALRERGEDVLELAQIFFDRFAKKYRRQGKALSPEVKNQLKGYHWPGNVRELKNSMERAVILNNEPGQPPQPNLELLPMSGLDIMSVGEKPTLDDLQRRYINLVMEETNNNLSRTATILGIKRTTLYKRMKKMGLR